MDLQAAWAPMVAQALAEMAPGERVGWLLNAEQAKQTTDKGEAVVAVAQFTMFSPSPVVGEMLHWRSYLPDPFPTPDKVNELVAKGLRFMREYASQQIANPPN